MEEQLISFETAKLAKKKGFNLLTKEIISASNIVNSRFAETFYYHYYIVEKGKSPKAEVCSTRSNCINGLIADYQDTLSKNNKYTWYFRTTQSLLQKWLREVHNIHIEVNIDILENWYFTAYNLSNKRCSEIPEIYEKGKDFKGTTYEEALEIGLQEALKLI